MFVLTTDHELFDVVVTEPHCTAMNGDSKTHASILQELLDNVLICASDSALSVEDFNTTTATIESTRLHALPTLTVIRLSYRMAAVPDAFDITLMPLIVNVLFEVIVVGDLHRNGGPCAVEGVLKFEFIMRKELLSEIKQLLPPTYMIPTRMRLSMTNEERAVRTKFRSTINFEIPLSLVSSESSETPPPKLFAMTLLERTI